MAGPRGSVKGTVLESRLAFLREEGGENLALRVLGRLGDTDRHTLTRGLLPMGWYPFELSERLDLAIAGVLNDPADADTRASSPRPIERGENIFRVLGASSASHNLGTSHRVYVRDRDPHGLLKQAAAIFRLYYDTGSRKYERMSANRAVLRTYDCQSFSRADCLTVVGWHERAIELCGGKTARVNESKCRARGNEICEYVCEWDGS